MIISIDAEIAFDKNIPSIHYLKKLVNNKKRYKRNMCQHNKNVYKEPVAKHNN